MKRLLVTLFLFIFASSAIAAELGKRGKKEYMGACGEADAGIVYAITNGSDAASCDPDQAVGTERIYCSCAPDGVGGYAWTLLFTALGGEEVDLSAYVLLAGDTDGQTIYGVAHEGDPSSVGSLLLGVGAESLGLLRSGTTGGSVFVNPTLARLRGPDSNVFFSATASKVEMDGSNGFASIKGGTAVRYTYGQTPPTNANDPCTAGDTIDTATFHYYCHSDNTWVRVAMATWP